MRFSVLEGVSSCPGRKSLLFAGVLPWLTLVDVLVLPAWSVEALLTRLLWSAELVVFALLFQRASEARRRVLLWGHGGVGTVFYLVIVYLTGGLASPYVNLVPTLPLVVAFTYPEDLGSAVASGVVCGLGVVAGERMGLGSFEQALGWESMVFTATFFGVFGSAQFRKAVQAQHEMRMERARREAVEQLALAEHRRAQSEKLATVGRLAASVIHELNNPLAYVRANVDYIQGEVFTQPLAPSCREDLEAVFAETRSGMERLQQIIRDLKGFSHSMDMEEVCACALGGVVEDAARLASIRLKNVGGLKVELPPELPKVLIAPRRLTQVLLNLLVNAGDALEGAGVERGEVRVRGEVRGPRVALLVEDNGPGFPPEVLPRLFDAFFTTKGPEKGTGLGLSISRELVERFGGTLDAQNRPEGGARLCIELPTHVPERAEVGQARLAG